MRRLALLVAVLLTGCAGCARGGDDGIDRTKLSRLVLQPADLPKVWVQFDAGRQARADAPPGERADPGRFGRLDGWKSRYRRSGTIETAGPLVIESRADLFEDADGAEEDFDTLTTALDRGRELPGAERLESPDVGDESVAAFVRQGAGTGATRFYLGAWRDGNVVAQVLVNGFERRVDLADAVTLARKQQARIDDAK